MKLKFLIITLLISFSSIAEEDLFQGTEEEQTEVSEENDSEENYKHEKKIATIQILNKITAKVQNIDIPINSGIEYGTLKIEINTCWKSSPYDLTENKILMHVYDKKPGQQNFQQIFSGWMFSSSPGISGVEHAVYDITAINCRD